VNRFGERAFARFIGAADEIERRIKVHCGFAVDTVIADRERDKSHKVR
jgi:hypothetical protein